MFTSVKFLIQKDVEYWLLSFKKKVEKFIYFLPIFLIQSNIPVCRRVVNRESPLSVQIDLLNSQTENRLLESEDNDLPVFFF